MKVKNQINKIESPKNGKNGSFETSTIAKNWFHVKSEWQENLDIYNWIIFSGIPRDINFNVVQDTFLGVEGIVAVHNLRIWGKKCEMKIRFEKKKLIYVLSI